MSLAAPAGASSSPSAASRAGPCALAPKAASAFEDDIVATQAVLVRTLQSEAARQLPVELRPTEFSGCVPEARLAELLDHWCARSQRPIVLLLDEIHALRGQCLVAVLRQLRAGYPIYQEVIARVLAYPVERAVTQAPRKYIRPDGSFDMDKLLFDFLAFWVEQGAGITETVTYREAAAQLVLMAFL